jgi:RHS repeat-associated protein
MRDRLGSSRTGGSKYFPYGEEQQVTPQDKDKFATYYRDGTTGLDYAQNRYYANTLGRFTSLDPYVASAGSANPQSWSRYSYVEGDPINYRDPFGLDKCGPDADTCVEVTDKPDPLPYKTIRLIWEPSVEPIPSHGIGGFGNPPIEKVSHDIADSWAAKVIAQQLSDCQALAGFAGSLAKWYSGSLDSFVSGFGALVDARSLPATLVGIQTSQNYVLLQPSNTYKSGFKQDFRDTLIPNSDQGHHFAAFLQFGYKFGSTAASLASSANELANMLVNRGDIELGKTAGNIGASLSNHDLKLQDLGEYIRNFLCDN